MKDTKTLLLLMVSLMLIVLSVFLLYTWTYRVKAIVATAEQRTAPLQPVVTIEDRRGERDSLQRFYNEVLGGINKSIDSVKNSTDSLKGNFSGKLEEFNQLKTEISNLLQKRDAVSPADNNIELAKLKITELQLRISQLRSTNSDISRENERLNALLAQLSAITKNNPQNTSFSNGGEARLTSNRPQEYSNQISTSDLRLVAYTEAGDNREDETNTSEQVSKLVVSFSVKNNAQQNNNVEIVVVVTQPDGRVLQKSTWETGTFETREGKKIYSYKTRTDFSTGETKRMSFSVSADRFLRGNYTMQVYNKGQLLATTSKTIS